MCVSGAGRGLTEGVQHEGPVLETAESEGGGTSGRFRQSSVGLPLHSAPGRVRSCEAHSRLDREEMALNVSGKTNCVYVLACVDGNREASKRGSSRASGGSL